MLFSLDTGMAICAYLYDLHFFFLSKQAAFERGYAKGYTFPYQRVYLSLPKGIPFPAKGYTFPCHRGALITHASTSLYIKELRILVFTHPVWL